MSLKIYPRGQKGTLYVDARSLGLGRISTGTTNEDEARTLLPGLIAERLGTPAPVAAHPTNTGAAGYTHHPDYGTPVLSLTDGFTKWRDEELNGREDVYWTRRRDQIERWFDASADHPYGKHTLLSAITRDDLVRLRNWFSSRPGRYDDVAQPATVNRKMAAIRRVLMLAANEWKMILYCPQLKELDPGDNRRAAVSSSEYAQVMEITRPKFQFFWQLLAETGLRSAEWQQLEWMDIDLDEGKIVLRPTSTRYRQVTTKAKNTRVVWLSDEVVAEFSRRKAEGMDRPLEDIGSYSNTIREWNRIRKAMGREKDFKFSPYSLRHACATDMINRGIPTAKVQKWMGHKRIETTMRYVHLSDQDLKDCRPQ